MQFSKSLDILYLDLCTSTIPAGITSIIIQASCVEQCKFPDQGLKVLVNMAPAPVEQYRADMPAVFYVVTRSQNVYKTLSMRRQFQQVPYPRIVLHIYILEHVLHVWDGVEPRALQISRYLLPHSTKHIIAPKYGNQNVLTDCCLVLQKGPSEGS